MTLNCYSSLVDAVMLGCGISWDRTIGRVHELAIHPKEQASQ